MINLCDECGRILPINDTGFICQTCKLTSNINFIKFDCPDCGQPMEVWSKQIVDYCPHSFDGWPTLTVDLIYHCECGNDWDSEYRREFGDESQTAPRRHYWG